MSRNKVEITKQSGNSVSIEEINRKIELTEETVKIVHLGTTIQTGVDAHYVHNQEMVSNTWTVVHNLNKYPAVAVVDSGGNVLYTEIEYIDTDTLEVRFEASTSGKAYLN